MEVEAVGMRMSRRQRVRREFEKVVRQKSRFDLLAVGVAERRLYTKM